MQKHITSTLYQDRSIQADGYDTKLIQILDVCFFPKTNVIFKVIKLDLKCQSVLSNSQNKVDFTHE